MFKKIIKGLSYVSILFICFLHATYALSACINPTDNDKDNLARCMLEALKQEINERSADSYYREIQSYFEIETHDSAIRNVKSLSAEYTASSAMGILNTDNTESWGRQKISSALQNSSIKKKSESNPDAIIYSAISVLITFVIAFIVLFIMNKTKGSQQAGSPGIGHIFMILITGLAAALILTLVGMFLTGTHADNFPTVYSVVFTIFLPINYMLFSYKYKCKKCGEKWAREESHTENIDSYTKTKQEEYYDGNFKRKRDVQYRIREYWQYFQCTKCGDVTREKEKSEERI